MPAFCFLYGYKTSWGERTSGSNHFSEVSFFIQIREAAGRHPSVSVASKMSLAQNNYAKVLCFGVAYSEALHFPI